MYIIVQRNTMLGNLVWCDDTFAPRSSVPNLEQYSYKTVPAARAAMKAAGVVLYDVERLEQTRNPD